MALAGIGAAVTYLDDTGTAPHDWVTPLVAATIIGFWAGWSQLGRSLGGQYLNSAFFALGAAFTAVVFLAILYSLRSAWITHFGVRFDEPIDVLRHVVEVSISFCIQLLQSNRTIVALLFGAFTAGIIAEFFNRIWR